MTTTQRLTDLSLSAACLASLPEAMQEEDKPATEDEAHQELGERFQTETRVVTDVGSV